MKITEAWLREWVNPSLTTIQLAEQLTMAGLEVATVHPVAGQFDHVVIARVLDVARHPQADRLSLCRVQINQTTTSEVVCGAANVRKGLIVAMALPGAHLPGGIVIKETKLRGCLSQGMLCSTKELGIEAHSEGIWELPEDAPIGVDLREYLMLNDHIIEIELTPNRGDCLSLFGIAREVAAFNDLAHPQLPLDKATVTHQHIKTVKVSEPAACPHYMGRMIRGLRHDATAPLWLQERLRRVGIRSSHPVVDVTNYIMILFGQPLHAFDCQNVSGDIHVRFAKVGEKITLLDGRTLTLETNALAVGPPLLIADDQHPLALAGIMGSEASGVTQDTVDVFIESALFNPQIISSVAREYGLTTDAAQRFERGVDFNLQHVALEQATLMIQSIAGGEAGPLIELTAEEHRHSPPVISFNPQRVNRLTGVALSDENTLYLLQSLAMKVQLPPLHRGDLPPSSRGACELVPAQIGKGSPMNTVAWKVTPPSYRHDLMREEDIIEEVIRRHGYQHLVPQPMSAPLQLGQCHVIESTAAAAADFFRQRGYQDTITYSFVDPELQQAIYPQVSVLQLINPLSSELSVMRAGLWPGLIASMVYNKNRQWAGMRLFETGVVFQSTGEETHCLAGLIMGQRDGLHWGEQVRTVDFFDLKGDVEALFKRFHVKSLKFSSAQHPALHPGQCAKLVDETHGEMGWVGAIHPKILDALDINEAVFVFQLEINALLNPCQSVFRAISKYPSIRRDLSLLMDQSIVSGQLEQWIRDSMQENWLKSYTLFDVYQGERVPAGKKSLAIALIFQEDNRTLTDDEINPVMDALIKKLHDDYGVSLREAT